MSTSISSAPSRRSIQPIRNSRKRATKAAPLDERTARLVKLGIALGAQAEGAVRSHARRALTEGESREEMRHVGLLALTTIGFPHTVAGLSWIEEVIEAAK
jgi:4-carboxymuconolactone decarboxylase